MRVAPTSQAGKLLYNDMANLSEYRFPTHSYTIQYKTTVLGFWGHVTTTNILDIKFNPLGQHLVAKQ
jgi:hypothetical protein